MLEKRRHALGMSPLILAERSGLPLMTVQMILAWTENMGKVCEALGLDLKIKEIESVDEWRKQQAEVKACKIVGMVQGSSQLESQGVDLVTRTKMVKRTVHELLTGPRDRLWCPL